MRRVLTQLPGFLFAVVAVAIGIVVWTVVYALAWVVEWCDEVPDAERMH